MYTLGFPHTNDRIFKIILFITWTELPLKQILKSRPVNDKNLNEVKGTSFCTKKPFY